MKDKRDKRRKSRICEQKERHIRPSPEGNLTDLGGKEETRQISNRSWDASDIPPRSRARKAPPACLQDLCTGDFRVQFLRRCCSQGDRLMPYTEAQHSTGPGHWALPPNGAKEERHERLHRCRHPGNSPLMLPVSFSWLSNFAEP